MSEVGVKDAFLDSIRKEPSLAQVVWEGTVLKRPTRYVSVFSDSGERESESFTGPQQTVTRSFLVHSVGATAAKAQEVSALVIEQVVDRVFDVAGRVCRPVQHEASHYTRLDQDIDPPLFYNVDEFSVISKPSG